MKRLRRIFMKLARVNTPSGSEARIIPYVISKLRSCGFKVGMDNSFGIIAIPKGVSPDVKLPTICAHMDTVNKKNGRNINLVYNQARRVIYTEGFSNVLGGDDKCGMAIALKLAEELRSTGNKFAIIFTRQEEVGGGARLLDESVWSICEYCITLDRRGKREIVSSISSQKLCSDKFLQWVKERHPCGPFIKDIRSCYSDAKISAKFCNSVNLACGYYRPHSVKEYVSVDDMYETYHWVKNMLVHGCEITK